MNRFLVKIAKELERKVKKEAQPAPAEKPHVLAAHKKLDESGGLIVHWGTGSGKTKFFLDAAKKALDADTSKPALIVAPASLVSNVDKELEKHKIKLDRKRLQVYSYEKANNISDELSKTDWSIAIADEAHKLRNPETQRAKSLNKVFERADKRVLATATANYNHSADISPLINIAAGGKVLPENRKEFENRYIRKVDKPRSLADRIMRRPAEQEEVLHRKGELGAVFKHHVHYYDPKDDPAAKDKFPKVLENVVETEMSPEQAKYYRFVEGQIPFLLRMKIRHNMPLDKKEKAQLNSFSTGVRQVSNSYRHLHQNPESIEYSPKMKKAVGNLEQAMKQIPNFRGLVYSNYLEAGVHEYSRLLTDKGIKHGVFTGQLNKAEKDKLRDDYNNGKLPVLLISSSGAEGLDLKGTRLAQVLDPHFNPSKIKQVVGRTARYESHEHLPKEERTVNVEYYHSTHPKGLFGKAPSSIDKYLYSMSDDKAEIFSQIKQVMKENS